MKRICTYTLTALFALISFGHSQESAPSESVLSNGKFEDGSDAWPADWGKAPTGGTWETEEGNRFIRLKAEEQDKNLMVYRALPIDLGWKALELRCRIRVSDLVPGAQAWHDARLILNFKNAEGEKVGKSPSPIFFRKDTDGWVEKTIKFDVPPDASQLEIMPSLMQVTSGSLDIDDLVITPVASE